MAGSRSGARAVSGDRAGHRGGGVPRDRAVERRAGGSEQRGMLILILVTPLLFAYGEVRVRVRVRNLPPIPIKLAYNIAEGEKMDVIKRLRAKRRESRNVCTKLPLVAGGTLGRPSASWDCGFAQVEWREIAERTDIREPFFWHKSETWARIGVRHVTCRI